MRAINRGFTLIELLIVVAIIAILAAIAVPNFLEAQTRSKVSRVKADLRTVAVGIQCYRVDRNTLVNGKDPTWFFLYWKSMQGVSQGIGYHLTTPIAYLTSIPLDYFNTAAVKKNQDPSNVPFTNIDSASFWYVYNYTGGPIEDKNGSSILFPGVTNYEWELQSAGPDLALWPETSLSATPQPAGFYDPTNGTVSSGDIWYFDTVGLRGGGGR